MLTTRGTSLPLIVQSSSVQRVERFDEFKFGDQPNQPNDERHEHSAVKVASKKNLPMAGFLNRLSSQSS